MLYLGTAQGPLSRLVALRHRFMSRMTSGLVRFWLAPWPDEVEQVIFREARGDGGV